MNTTFRSGASPCARTTACASTTCAAISSAASERTTPIVPVMQKRQPRTQPTWLDTHTVLRPAVGMTTISTS
jgi:hypothetical protein